MLGIQGPVYSFNGTCSSGAIAIGHAYQELRAGNIDVALAGGHDACLIAPIYHMYRAARDYCATHWMIRVAPSGRTAVSHATLSAKAP